jgi:IS30 family transposase
VTILKEHKHLSKDFSWSNIYYAHPYPSSERGSNERQNRLVPYFIQKGTLMETIHHEKVREIETWINEMPRKIFHWKNFRKMMEMLLNPQ